MFCGVAVDDALLVSGIQAPRHLHGHLDRVVLRKLAFFLDVFLEGEALDQFHDDVVGAELLADIVHADHVRVGQAAGRLRLAGKLGHDVGVTAVFLFQDLYGNKPLKRHVFRLVDVRHAA